MSLHLVRIRLNPSKLARWAMDRGWARKGRAEHYDESSALHHLLVESFGRGTLQPFRLMVAPGEYSANLYAYTKIPAASLCKMLDVACLPDAASVFDTSRIQSKAMPSNLVPGQRLGFDARLRPVVRQRKANSRPQNKVREIDAFLAEAIREHPDDKSGMMLNKRSREAVYFDWLSARLDGAATLETARLVRFRRSRAVRGGRIVEGPDVVIQGNLKIDDPEIFRLALSKGIGRHRAYGYGMILLRPPDTRAPTC